MLRDGRVVDDLDAFGRQRATDRHVDLRVLCDEVEDAPAERPPAAPPRSGRRASGATLPASTCWRRPATRTWKNSSRLPAKMARNLTRSRSGFRSSRASCRTRALNSSQDSSRLRYGNVALARVARRWRGATVGRAGAPGSMAAMGEGVLSGRVGTVRHASTPRPARIACAHAQSSGTYRRSPDTASSQTRIRWPDRRVDEDLVAPTEARVETRAGRFAAGRAGGQAGAIGRLGAVADALDERGDDEGRSRWRRARSRRTSRPRRSSPIRARPPTSIVTPSTRTTPRAAPRPLLIGRASVAYSTVGVAAEASGATMTAVP